MTQFAGDHVRGKSGLAGQIIRFALLAVLLVSLAVSTSAPVLGHARLIGSDPPSGSALAIPPDVITLTFNETVDIESANLDLLDTEGNPVAIEPPRGNAGASETLQTTIADPAGMTPGVYTLVWRVLSTVDGHITSGSVAFSVGTGEAPVGAGLSASQRPPWWSVLSRWIELTGFVAVAGIVLAALVQRKTLFSLDDRQLNAAMLERWRSAWLIACWRGAHRDGLRALVASAVARRNGRWRAAIFW